MTPSPDWLRSDYARQYLQTESQYVAMAVKHIAGPTVLQVGNLFDTEIASLLDFPLNLQLMSANDSLESQKSLSSAESHTNAPIVADPAFLPFADESVTSLFLPHVLETSALPHQVLRESHRVLRSEGWLILTGFNPYSFIGLQSVIYRRAVYSGTYYSLHRVKDWLKLLGFEVVSSAMFQYAPLSKSARLKKVARLLESIGDRWMPLLGGGYMILVRKRTQRITLVGQTSTNRIRRPKLANVATGKVAPCRRSQYK